MPKTEVTHGRKPRQVSADDRSRVALGKSGVGAYENFFVTVFESGQILLTPVVSIPKNEVPLWNDPEFMNSLTKMRTVTIKPIKPQPRSKTKVKV